jgi:peptidoglycan/xylan/chitin deacetylase (PgdA/CDA1 family)
LRPFQYISITFVAVVLSWILAYRQYSVSWWWLLAAVIIYLHLLVIGAIRIRWNFFLKSLHHNPAAHQQIALTFDDGPAAKTQAILDILKRENVQAGFFSIGKNARLYPETVKRWDDEGHLVGNHSYNHGFNFDWLPATKMAEELEQTNATILDIIGKKPLLFRPPYGVTNPNVAKAVKMTGMISIGWNIRSFDTTAKDPGQLLQRILGQMKGGDVILLHDSMDITCEILTPLIHAAREKGYTFVRPDRLLGIQAYA